MSKLITFKDGFAWLDVTDHASRYPYKLFESEMELYTLHDDDSESLIESVEELQEALSLGLRIGLEVGHIRPKESWWSKADKILQDGFWYIKSADIK